MRKAVKAALFAVIVVGLLRTSAAGRAPTGAATPPELDTVLTHLVDVAAQYRDEALQFTCQETIVYTSKRQKVSQHFEYIYVYDPTEGLLDYRVDRKDEKAEIVHGGLERPYSWIFVFEATKADRYRYEVTGLDRALDRDAVKVRFDPVPPYEIGVNDFEGIAWVDLDTWQLLRVESERVKAVRKALDQEYTERFKTEFGIEMHGMRFPSSVGIRRANFGQRGRPGTADYQSSAIFRVSQIYSDYRFFGVRSEEDLETRTLSEEDRSR